MRKNKSEAILLRMSEKMKSETSKCAEIEQENLSEYVRKSVEMRNEALDKKIEKKGER